MMSNQQPLKKLSEWYSKLSPTSLNDIGQYYAADAYFKDPFNEVTGRDLVKNIFVHMFASTVQPRFVILETLAQGDAGFLTWKFLFTLKGRDYTVFGSSHFRFDQQGLVVYHRDYWDAAEELWQKLPIIGVVVKWLRKRFAVK